MGRVSVIRRLPPELRAAIEEKIMGGYTLDEIVEHVRSLGAEVSRSAVHRYKKGFQEILDRAERARMLAQMLVNSNHIRTEDDAVRAGVEMLHGLIFSAIEGLGEDGKFSTSDAMKLAVALQHTVRAAKLGAELKRQREDDARAIVDTSTLPDQQIEVTFVQPFVDQPAATPEAPSPEASGNEEKQ